MPAFLPPSSYSLFSLRTLTSSSLVHRSNSCHVSPLPSCPQFYLHPRRNNAGSAESQQTPHGDFSPSHFSGSHRPRKCSFGTLILLFFYFISSQFSPIRRHRRTSHLPPFPPYMPSQHGHTDGVEPHPQIDFVRLTNVNP